MPGRANSGNDQISRPPGFCTDDVATAAGVLMVFFAHKASERAVIDTALEHVVYEAVAVAVMFAVVARNPSKWFATPFLSIRTPPTFRRRVLRFPVAVVVGGAMTASSVLVVRIVVEGAAGLVWPPAPDEGVGCRSYNDPECSRDDVVVDVVEVLTASIGEEFAYRFAFLVIAARFIGVPGAVVAQAVVWALSHTGFENGYGAAVVAGLMAAGIIYAAVAIVTGSIWPAVVAHAIHSLGVAASDHDLGVIADVVLVVNAIGVVGLAVATATAVIGRNGPRSSGLD